MQYKTVSLAFFDNYGRNLQSSIMEVKYAIYLIILASIRHNVISTTTTKDVRTGVLLKPEKFINGVIDIVQSHKNKPTQNTQYPNYQQYPQQWNAQSNYQNGNFQNGFNSQTQYQGQFNSQNQYTYQNGFNQNFPQNGNYQGFNGQGQGQQYQIVYQNTPNQNGNQGSGQYFTTQPSQGVNQGTGQYQTSAGQYQGSGNYQGNQYQGSGQYQGGSGQYQSTGQFQGSGSDGQINGQGFMVSNGQAGPGPTCVCQAWTKPQADALSDTPTPDKVEKASDIMQSRMI
ncbi:unnamed protein product [Leptosia nina]|uniref:Uncharacterized protein n=1 Tax=Leptosia nina TaxID=320188 RepID=A0AAV1JM92_9NEOP